MLKMKLSSTLGLSLFFPQMRLARVRNSLNFRFLSMLKFSGWRNLFVPQCKFVILPADFFRRNSNHQNSLRDNILEIYFLNTVYVYYVKLSRKRPDFEKLSRDQGQQPRTLYSSLIYCGTRIEIHAWGGLPFPCCLKQLIAWAAWRLLRSHYFTQLVLSNFHSCFRIREFPIVRLIQLVWTFIYSAISI